MGKLLAVLVLLTVSTSSFALCEEGEKNEVNSKRLHAGVYARDNLRLEFVLSLKSYVSRFHVRYFGGKNVSLEKLPECPAYASYEPEDEAQPKNFITKERIVDTDHFSGRYRICEYEETKLDKSYVICNAESGD